MREKTYGNEKKGGPGGKRLQKIDTREVTREGQQLRVKEKERGRNVGKRSRWAEYQKKRANTRKEKKLGKYQKKQNTGKK